MFAASTVTAQLAPHKYFIEFKDKNQNPWSLTHPEEFLSQRALDRRSRMGIGVDNSDLPVTPAYLQSLQNLGAKILNPTKWLNGTTVYLADTNIIKSIRNLPFVKSVVKNSIINPKEDRSSNKFYFEDQSVQPILLSAGLKIRGNYNYGESWDQIHMVNGDVMHTNGFRGQGVVIAQLDAGFYKVPVLPAFDSLRANNQILGYKDFVKNGLSMTENPDDQHGMWVLSVIAGILPGHLIGAAPKASFWLLSTEEKRYEYETEEYNWVSGAEFADSVGADIITSSLGYTVFDSIFQDHYCSDMNGNKTVCSRGANIAFSKGLIVIVSAGNDGLKLSWRCVSAPADANYAIACAAVDSNGKRADFSSVGIDTSGRVKPNLAAMGELTVIQDASGSASRGSGTSFAAPIIAGMTACLIQASPGYPNTFYKTAIERSCSHFSSPDSLTGFGIPDFVKAMNLMNINDNTKSNSLNIYPNPVKDKITLEFISQTPGAIVIRIIDSMGKTVKEAAAVARAGENSLIISGLSGIEPGIYHLLLTADHFRTGCRMTKLPD